jgi:hypothetical protein
MSAVKGDGVTAGLARFVTGVPVRVPAGDTEVVTVGGGAFIAFWAHAVMGVAIARTAIAVVSIRCILHVTWGGTTSVY